MEKKEIIQPISFGNFKPQSPITFEKKEVIKPIIFTDISKAKCPIIFVDNEKNVSDTKEDNQSVEIITVKASEVKEEVVNTTNYKLIPLYRRIYIRRDGTIDYQRNEMDVKIVIDEFGLAFKDTFRIKITDIDRITKVVGKKYPDAILYSKKDTEEVVNSFREKCRQAKLIYCYPDAGWQLINGKQTYLHKGILKEGMEVMTPLLLPVNKNCSIRDLETIWTTASSIYKDSDTVAVLLLYSFLGVSYKLFDTAGFAPHFLLFMTGKTGSFKTTIAKLLYTQLTEERYRDFPRRIDADTVTSFERALVVSGVDTVTLIDDYSPAKTQRSAVDMANKLESIIRMVGDGSTKSRSNVSLEDCRGEGVKGMVVLTGELQGKGLSSNLRCLYCEIEQNKVNLEAVTWLQRNRDYYCTFVQHFVWFLGDVWETISLNIPKSFERYRRITEKWFDARRLMDVVATLFIVADILRAFLISYCEMSEDKVDVEIRNMKQSVVNVAKRSEMLSVEEEPALRFMKVLVDMWEKGKISVESERLSEMTISYTDGFSDADYLYLLPENVYLKVTNYLRTGGLYLGVDREHLGKMLCNEGYAVATPNGKNKQTYYARVDMGAGRKINFLKIPKEVFFKIQKLMDGRE